jgi:hypothetical protein
MGFRTSAPSRVREGSNVTDTASTRVAVNIVVTGDSGPLATLEAILMGPPKHRELGVWGSNCSTC